ncbi:MAG: zinc finger protein [Pseudonocardiaceae bacterium]
MAAHPWLLPSAGLRSRLVCPWLEAVPASCLEPHSPREVSSLPIVPPPYPKPRLFAWFPLAGQRHAIDRRDRNVALGEPMRCLCAAIHPRGADGDMEWLWPTCDRCWEETCMIVGLRRR